MLDNRGSCGPVLVVDDDPVVLELVQLELADAGYATCCASSGAQASFTIARGAISAAVLDVNLPDRSGYEVCREIRRLYGPGLPIVFISGDRKEPYDRVGGLLLGADDYLVKPFEPRELEARIRALIRRERRQVSSEVYQVGDLTLDTATLRIVRGGEELQVSPIGLKLLTILMRESPRVVSRHDIEREIWGDTLPDSDTLRSHLYNLRRVVDKPYARPLLHTIHSAGYRIADLDEEAAASASSA